MTTLFRIFLSEDTEIVTPIEKNYHDIQLTIDTAAASVGRDPREVLLVAVSKTVGVAVIEEATRLGIHDFGENRTKVLLEKQQGFPNERWHFIGHIQTNKLKEVVGRAILIHSVASKHALEVINTLALARGVCQSVLIEANVSGEASKDGATPAEVPGLLEYASTRAGIEVKGLMTMAPMLLSHHDDTARSTFAALRELRDNLVPVFSGSDNISLNELSMGMSDDFGAAILEGATIIRIGRRLWS
ncbi:MAG: YggS family pyridoxal phosphate-dependent enzyme [Coriobacteriales bacterium]|nr:YggS family pyridoxal phosphate-dependent enzyme [Coriobacteriales bacterium]